MSRSGYTDDNDDQWASIRWRGAVKSALSGKRGQAFLRELLSALDAMPEKELTTAELQVDGQFCALGVVGQARGVDLAQVDTEDWQQLSSTFGIAESMAREIMYENDDCVANEEWTDVEIHGPMRPNYPDWNSHKRSVLVPVKRAGEQRWFYMRKWVASQITNSERT